MATSKEYGYQIKGNKFAIVEKDVTSLADGLNYTHSEGDGLGITSGDTIYKSPLSSIANGIQLEYVYSPEYYYNTDSLTGTNKWSIDGWIIVDEYLTFVQGYPNGAFNFGGGVVSADEYILVKNSSRWNGVHKVQATENGATDSSVYSGIKTYTKVSAANYKYFTGDPNVTSTTIGVNAQLFEVGDYVWQSAGVTDNIGLYRVSAITDLGGAGLMDILTLDIRVHNKVSQKYSTEDQESAVSMTADSSGTTYVYQAFRESPTTHIVTGIDVLSDESDTIDLPSYLSKALVYYVKGRLMEDQLDIKGKEYFMREFQRMVEKHESSKVTGPRQLMSGNSAIR